MSDIRCPKCHAPLAFGEKSLEWASGFGDDYDAALGGAIFFVYCSTCDSEAGLIVDVTPFTRRETVIDPQGRSVAIPIGEETR